MSNTSSPFGATSTDSQVPRSVSKAIVRAGTSGRPDAGALGVALVAAASTAPASTSALARGHRVTSPSVTIGRRDIGLAQRRVAFGELVMARGIQWHLDATHPHPQRGGRRF